MKLHMIQDLKKSGPLPPIFLRPNHMIRRKPYKNQESHKVNIKTHTGEANSEMVLTYVPIFKTSLAKSLLKFLVLLKKN